MAFEKSLDLMRLAEMCAARYQGVSLADIMEEFSVTQRTAQRMIRGLEMVFCDVEILTDENRRRRWKLKDPTLLRFQGLRVSELAALSMSIRRAKREGAHLDVTSLTTLRNRLLATMLQSNALRTATDAEAILEAQGFACHPGPRTIAPPEVLSAISEGIMAPFTLNMLYQSAKDPSPTNRSVEPYGLLRGIRQYLIARDLNNNRDYRRYRVDRIVDVSVTGQSFVRDPEFNLDQFAATAFGSFFREEEFGLVVWRFTPLAANSARDFEFHPSQKMTEEADGSLRVEFFASGWTEMLWHLYQWGDQVQVIAPPKLKELIDGFQRSDFSALP